MFYNELKLYEVCGQAALENMSYDVLKLALHGSDQQPAQCGVYIVQP